MATSAAARYDERARSRLGRPLSVMDVSLEAASNLCPLLYHSLLPNPRHPCGFIIS